MLLLFPKSADSKEISFTSREVKVCVMPALQDRACWTGGT